MAEYSQYLDFEQPVVDLQEQLNRMRAAVESGDLSQAAEVEKIERRLDKVRSDVYDNLSAYQRVRLCRHLGRPFTLDYVSLMLEDFTELHGDRRFADDPSIVGGIGKFENISVMVVGHQRGRTTTERVRRNFGMPQPEGNRKAQRLFKMAEKFNMPLLLFIDTQGAYPGLEAEARGQAESIASSLYVLAGLKTPIISTVIGEGGSGGALALGICDRLLMLENATYSVITPEGCASILWGKSDAANVGEHAKIAAESLRLTAQSLLELRIADEVVKEPIGGAHWNHAVAADYLKQAISKNLHDLQRHNVDEILELRYKKFRESDIRS